MFNFFSRARKAPELSRLDMSDSGITRWFGSGNTERESIAWNEVQELAIQTTDAGPWQEDFFFVLSGSAKGVLVPNEVAGRHDLLTELQKRFPGLDNEKVIEASACTGNMWFSLWSRPRKE